MKKTATSRRSIIEDYLAPPYTLVPPQGWVLCKRVEATRTLSGILTPETTWGEQGKGSTPPLVRVVESGPPHEGQEMPWQPGDVLLVGGGSMAVLPGGHLTVDAGDVVAVVRPGAHGDDGEVYMGDGANGASGDAG